MGQSAAQAWQILQPGISLFYLDAMHPGLGNKGYKLKPILHEAKARGASCVVSLGGVWSNHVLALAQLGNTVGLSTVGLIRGDAAAPRTAMLNDAVSFGMHLEFISRGTYRNRHLLSFVEQIEQSYPGSYFVPEGGSSALGVAGAREIVGDVERQLGRVNELYLPVGTGGTMAGILCALNHPCHVVGVSALKKIEAQQSDIARWTQGQVHPGVTFELLPETRFGGYGRFPPALQRLMQEFEAAHNVLLDPIYNAKCLAYALRAAESHNKKANRVILHTGGLQGRRGYPSLEASLNLATV